MIRRDAILALLALAAPLEAFAQKSGKVWRIGVLAPASAAKPGEISPHGVAFMGAMQAAGHAFERDYVMEIRSAEGDYERLPALASELVRLNVDILLAVTPVAVSAVQQASKSIPIVCIGALDPVGQGFAASLARPGGNLTGLATFYADLMPKHLELLRSIAPKVSRVAILAHAKAGRDASVEQTLGDAARKMEIRLQLVSIDSAEQFPQAFAAMKRERAGGFIAVADPMLVRERRQIAELALKHRLPSLFANRENVQAGGLMSYGEDFVDMFAQAARYVTKIMKGAKPGDLPIEQPTKFQLTINRKTAAALKLAIPQEILLRADEVIG